MAVTSWYVRTVLGCSASVTFVRVRVFAFARFVHVRAPVSVRSEHVRVFVSV